MNDTQQRLEEIRESLQSLMDRVGEQGFIDVMKLVFLRQERLEKHLQEQGEAIDSLKGYIRQYSPLKSSEAAGEEIVAAILPIINQLVSNREAAAVEQQKYKSATHAVSQREDQLLKPKWCEHVLRCIEEGIEIRTLNDLLDRDGYDPNLTRIRATTLRKWAREAVPGLQFKAGRPTNK